jgi:PAS domain S-box-containing protein
LSSEALPFARVRDTNAPVFGIEHAIEWPDGTRRLLSVNGAPLHHEDGSFAGGVFLIDDVTEQKQMERQLRESEARFRTLAERTSDIISRHAADGTYLYASPSVERILGYTPDDLVGRNPYDLILDADRERVETAHERILEGEPLREEFRMEHADGHAVWVEAVGRLIPDEDGAPEAVLSTRPIGDRKEAEEKLRKSRERWQQLVENQRDAIHISVDGIVRYVNAAGVELIGADAREEVVGRSLAEFVTSDAAEREIAERVQKVEDGETVPLVELEIERLDGETRIVEAYAVPIEYEGESAVQGIIRDVTERKRTQKQLRQAQKMETVGALAGGIAHDFNNILHSVTAYVQMVQDDLREQDANRTLLARAAQGLDRAGTLVQKLLTFSRKEPSDQVEEVDVGAIARESIDLVAPSLPNHVDVRVEVGESCTVQGAPGELHQVATNILTNAAQAMENDAATDDVLDVDVRTSHVDEDLAQRHLGLEPGTYVRLSVSDTGPGMDAETKEHVFEPFFTTKEVGEGTGLGLSVVHGIVQSLGGAIVVYSEPGEGTTVDVYLPREVGPEAATDSADEEEQALEPGDAHVLFVDDDAHITEMEAVRLRRLGYAVTPCDSPQDALQAFDETPDAFDIVVTDFSMPSMNGLTLTRKLRDRGCTAPIVLMSGFSAQVSQDDVQSTGVSTFLRKPVGGDELAQVLARLLAS